MSKGAELQNERELNDNLDFLEKEIVTLLVNDKMFKEVGGIISGNSVVNHKNSFYDWMVSAYISDVTIRIRRLVDEDQSVKSFVNFLKELKGHQHFRTRDYHVNFYKDNFVLEGIGNNTFDGLAGVGASVYDEILVQKDIDDLKAECFKIVLFTHNYIAHTNRKIVDNGGSEKVKIPTFTDLENAIRHVDKLLIKYFLLLRAVGKGESLMPHWQYNWKSIFEVPWMQKPL